MNEETWINDMTYICDDCGARFRVYFEEGETTNFCPSCASRNLTGCDDE